MVVLRGKKIQTESAGKPVSGGGLPEILEKEDFYCICVTGGTAEDFAALPAGAYCAVSVPAAARYLVVPCRSADCLEKLSGRGGIYTAVSRPFRGAACIKTAFREALIASYGRFVDSNCHEFFYSGFPIDFSAEDIVTRIIRLLTVLGTGSSGALSVAAAGLFAVGSYNPAQTCHYLYLLYEHIKTNILDNFWKYSETNPHLGLKAAMLESLEGIATIAEWSNVLTDYVLSLDFLLKKERAGLPFIKKALSFMDANFNKDINMAVVANHVSVNYTYFSEKFKEYTGLNFNEYLKKMRLNEAKRLLEKGCYKVYEVAAHSGFSDVKYFMKMFKAYTGLSPGEYKKKSQNNNP